MKKDWLKKGTVLILTIAIFMVPVSAGVRINNKYVKITL